MELNIFTMENAHDYGLLNLLDAVLCKSATVQQLQIGGKRRLEINKLMAHATSYDPKVIKQVEDFIIKTHYPESEYV